MEGSKTDSMLDGGPRGLLGASWGSHWAAPGALVGLEIGPNLFQDAQGRPQDGSWAPSWGARWAHIGSKTPQDGPRSAQESPKTAPRYPRKPHDAPKCPPQGPRQTQDYPRTATVRYHRLPRESQRQFCSLYDVASCSQESKRGTRMLRRRSKIAQE